MVRQWILRHKILFIILLVSFLLRVIPILWGIPISPFVRSFHPDEPKVFSSIRDFPGVYWTTKPYLAYGTSVQYVIGTLLLPVKIVLVGFLDLRDLYSIVAWIAARLASAAMGAGTVYLAYRLAQKLFDEKAALVTAAFLSTSLYHTLNSAIITVDVAMGFLLTLNILLCFRAVESNRWPSFIGLGAATALLVGTKLPAGIFAIIPVLLVFQNAVTETGRKASGRTRWAEAIQFLSAYGATALAVFLMIHPHILLDPGKFAAFYLDQKVNWLDRIETSPGGMLSIWARETVESIGWPVALLALAGFLAPGKTNLRYKLALIVFLVLYFLFWRWSWKARYVIAVAPLFCMFAASASVRLLGAKTGILRWAGGGAIALALTLSLYADVSGIYLRLNDTRPPAARFIAESVPAGTTVGMAGVSEKYGWRTHPWQYPRVDFDRYREMEIWEEPDIVILTSYAYLPVLSLLEPGRLSPGYVPDPAENRKWYRYSPPSPRIFRFYDALLNETDGRYVLLKAFKPTVNVPMEFPPPEIRIYQKVT